MMPAAPFVGAVTTRPPAAFSSFTARAYRLTQSSTVSGSPALGSSDCGATRPPPPHLAGRPAGRRRRQPALHALLHDAPDVEQPGVTSASGRAMPSRSHITCAMVMALALALAGAVPSPMWNGTGRIVVSWRSSLLRGPSAAPRRHDKPASHRVVRPRQQFAALAVVGGRSAGRWGGRASSCAEEQVRALVERDWAAPSRRSIVSRTCCRRASIASMSTLAGSSPSSPSITALSLPWPLPVAPSDPYSSHVAPVARSEQPVATSPAQTTAPPSSVPPCANSTAQCRS